MGERMRERREHTVRDEGEWVSRKSESGRGRKGRGCDGVSGWVGEERGRLVRVRDGRVKEGGKEML